MIDRYILQYGRRLYGLCRSLCKNTFDADDLYQETWLKALRYFSQYDPQRPFEPWLTRICVNTYRNTLRRFAKRAALEGISLDSTVPPEAESIPPPEIGVYEPLHRAIGQLPEKLRVTVILFYFQDLDTAGTAKALGISPGTVKSRLNKARKLLREVLHESDLQF